MWSRLSLSVLGLFWLTMLGLLCWSEFGGRRHLGMGASVETIWDKILTCPDASALTIRLDGEDIGYCQWRPEVIEGGARSQGAQDAKNLEGMYREIAAYRLTVGSSFSIPGEPERFRVSTILDFSPSKEWETLKFEIREGREFLTLNTSAKDKTFQWSTPTGSMQFSEGDLHDPQQLISRLGGPFAAMAFGSLPSVVRKTVTGAESAPRWEAKYSWIEILNQPVRCYELTTRVLDRRITVFVSLVGEILLVELPNGIQLANTTEAQL